MRFIKAVNQCRDLLATYIGKFKRSGKTYTQLLTEHLETPVGSNQSGWLTKVKFLALSSGYLEGRVLTTGRLSQMRGGKRIPVNKMVFDTSRVIMDVAAGPLDPELKLEVFKQLSCLFVASYAQSNYLTYLGSARNFLEEEFKELRLAISKENVTTMQVDRSWRRRNDPVSVGVSFSKGVFAFPIDGLLDLVSITLPTFEALGIPPGDIPRELLLSPWIQDHHQLWNIPVQAYADCVDIQSWNNLQKEGFLEAIIEHLVTFPFAQADGFAHACVAPADYASRTETFVYDIADRYGINVSDIEIQRIFGEFLKDKTNEWKDTSWSGIRDKKLGESIAKLQANHSLVSLGHPSECLLSLLGKPDTSIKSDVINKLASELRSNIAKVDSELDIDVGKLAMAANHSECYDPYAILVDDDSYRRNYDEWEVNRADLAMVMSAKMDKVFSFLRQEVLALHQTAQNNLDALLQENKEWLPDMVAFFVKLGVNTDPSHTIRLYCKRACSRYCRGDGHEHPRITLETINLAEEDAEYYNVVRVVDALVASMKDSLIRSAFDAFSVLSNTEVAEILVTDVGSIF